MRQFCSSCIFCLAAFVGQSQFQLEWNAGLDTELTKSASGANYYVSEINSPDWTFDLARLHWSATLTIGQDWELSVLPWIERRLGNRSMLFQNSASYQLSIPLLHLKKHFGTNWSLTLGRFQNPFGRFYRDILYKDRTLLSSPLAYAYFVNISTQVGWVEQLGNQNRMRFLGEPDWGLPLLYNSAYKTGIRLDWQNTQQSSWSIALVDGALNLGDQNYPSLNWGLVSSAQFQPTYYAQLGFSAALGSFRNESDLADDVPQLYQTLLGMDFELGVGFLEVSGELIGAYYRVPLFLFESKDFHQQETVTQHDLFAWSGYLDFKYEFARLPGSYAALRLEWLDFSSVEAISANWDDRVLRQTFALGYRATEFWQLKASFAVQQILGNGQEEAQSVLRVMSILYW